MAVPSSGELELYGDIGTELGVAQSNVTLHGMSQTAGFTPPDAMSEFYGYDPTPPVTTSFNTVLYTGTSVADSVTGFGFDPDFVWIKNRSAAASNIVFDRVRGDDYALFPNLTDSESLQPAVGQQFITDGFRVEGNWIVTDRGGDNYVMWGWKAGGTAVTNTDGTITSQVSANVSGGFSIVSYTTPAGLTAFTLGHGLAATPSVIIVKDRVTNGVGWHVFHSSLSTPQQKFLQLNTTNAVDSSTGIWNNTLPTNSVFSQIAGYATAGNAASIAYCFAEIAGFSKFGTYTGNGSTNGPTITTGFQPAFVMVKCTSSAGTNWTIWDNKRDTSNPITVFLQANNTGTEASARNIDFNATSFQLKSGEINENASGQTYTYMAFANQF
jgi:hypothetical protein